MPLKQDTRLLAIKTALGADALAVRSITLREELSRLFQIEADLISEDANVDLDQVIGRPATVRLDTAQKGKRFFNGFVSRIYQGASEGGYARFRAVIVPWLWFLTRTSDCRIFQAKSVPDIIEAVFKGRGFTDYQLQLSGSYLPKDYCVQYRETDFNFVSRLMEQEGIYYFFRHQEDKHILVLADSISAHTPTDLYAEVPFSELEKGAAQREGITEWAVEKELQPVACALNDFDFTKPKTSLRSTSHVTRQHAKAEYEIYDYPGEYADHANGDRLADVRLNEIQTQFEVFHGQASARGLAAGCTFKLKNHPRKPQNRDYLITSIDLKVEAGDYATDGRAAKQGEFFSCALTALDKNQQFRPERLTPKPILQGPQTAIVVGPAGEEVHTDSFGRVKVKFHWDRYSKADENSSCWVRVSQNWAGKNWGGMFIPHVGQEVIVECLEGDPDRPIITGRVYNADQMPPLDLPAHKKKSIIRDDYGNQILFDATEGDEHISIYSPHHRSTLDIGRSTKMKTESQTHAVNLGNSFTVDIGSNASVFCGANASIYGGVSATAVLGGAVNFLIGGGFDFFVGAKATFEMSGKYEYTRGFKYSNVAGVELSAGSEDYYKHSKKNIVLDADEKLALIGGHADHAIIKMSSNSIHLSFGVGNDKGPLDTERSQTHKAVAGVAVGLITAAAAAGGIMLASAYATKNEGSNLPPTDPTGADHNQSVPDIDETKMGIGGGVLGGVCLLGAIALAGLGKKLNSVQPVSLGTRTHSDIHAEVKLMDSSLKLASGKSLITINKDGSIIIENDEASGQIQIFSKEKIVLNSKEAIQIVAPQVEASKGIFKTKNIQDLG